MSGKKKRTVRAILLTMILAAPVFAVPAAEEAPPAADWEPGKTETGETEPPAAKPYPARGKRIALAACAAIVLLVGVALFGYWNYRQAVTYMLAEDFAAADTCYNRSLFMGSDRDMVRAYIDAGLLLEARDYDGARAAFEALANEGGWDAEQMAYEARYRQAAAYADADDYDDAVRIYAELAGVAYKGSAELVDRTKFRQAVYLLGEKDGSVRALTILKKLQDDGFRDDALDDTVLEAREAVLQDGISQYRWGNYQTAYTVYFSQIPDYEASYIFIMLCAAHHASPVLQELYSADTVVEALKSRFYFEDTGKLLVGSWDIACAFLKGTWRTKGGGDDLEMTAVEGGYKAVSTLPTRYTGTFDIEDGILSIKTSSGNYHDEFKITVQDPDTIIIHCYEDGRTYTLYRA